MHVRLRGEIARSAGVSARRRHLHDARRRLEGADTRRPLGDEIAFRGEHLNGSPRAQEIVLLGRSCAVGSACPRASTLDVPLAGTSQYAAYWVGGREWAGESKRGKEREVSWATWKTQVRPCATTARARESEKDMRQKRQATTRVDSYKRSQGEEEERENEGGAGEREIERERATIPRT
eukprot:6173457-Pleurochrysis_carterae.AAC.3